MQKKFSTVLSTSLLSFTAISAHADHLSGGFGLQIAAPFWTGSPITLNQGQFNFGVRTQFQKLRSFSDEKLVALRKEDAINNPELYEDHHDEEEGEDDSAHARQADLHSVEHLLGGSFRFAYGVTDDLTVGLRLPFVYRSNIREVESGHDHGHGFAVHNIFDHGDSQGIGDMSFWGQYRFFNNNGHQAAILLGFKAPTGDTTNTGFKRRYNYLTPDTSRTPANNTDHSDRLETHLQPGSGSWDGMFGLTYGYDFEVITLNASVLYSLATEGSQATDLGDKFNYNFAASMPIKAFTPCDNCSWNLIMELNGEWQDREERSGITINNSGGHTLYFSPGIRFISNQNWSIGTSFGYAVITDQNGNQSEPDYRAMGTISFNL